MWKADTGQCLHTLKGHQSLTSGMELRKNILVSGNADSTVKVGAVELGWGRVVNVIWSSMLYVVRGHHRLRYRDVRRHHYFHECAILRNFNLLL